MNDLSYVFKVVVVGDSRVGKTSLIKMFTQASFDKKYIKTIGAQLSVYIKEINREKIKLLFWDIAGEDTFHFLRASFFNNSKAAIIVYSLEENKLGENSLFHIPDWVSEVVKYCGTIPLVLFANKVDLVDEDTLDHVKIHKVAEENNFLGSYITSAKTGQGVIDAFNSIIEELYFKFRSIPAEL
jgi:small GTP-binding protein